MSKTIVGIIFHDTKVYFVVFDKTYPNIQKIKPIDLAISFHDGKVTTFDDAYKKGTCITGLTNCATLKEKLQMDANAMKYCGGDIFTLWVLLMKKIKEIIVSKIDGQIDYIISIPETNQLELRDVIYIGCKANDMNLLKIIPSNVCAMIGFQTNSFYSRKDGNGYLPKIFLNVNLDDEHTTFTTFYVSRERVVKLHSTNARLGMNTFVYVIAQHILQGYGVTLDPSIDKWELKHRKKLNDFFNVINSFSEGNVTKTYYRDDDDNVVSIEKSTVEHLFANYLNYLSAIAGVEIKAAFEALELMREQDPEIARVIKLSGMFFTGEHKNALVINAVEAVAGVINDTTVNQQMVIAEGCGWICEKTRLKGLSDREQATQDHLAFIYERCVDIESIIEPGTIFLMTREGAQVGQFPAGYQMSRDPIMIENSAAGAYNIFITDNFFDLNGQQQQEYPLIGYLDVQNNNFGIYINQALGNMVGNVSSYDLSKKPDQLVEDGCQLPPSTETQGPNGDELKPERFSDMKEMDGDLNCAVVYIGEQSHHIEVMTLDGEIYSHLRDFNVEEYKKIFATEDQQNRKIEIAAEKAADIKQRRVKQLIAYCGDGKRKEIIRDMNKMIKANKDDPDQLEGAWQAIVKNYAPGQNF